jgi:hypothetical protein
MAKITQLPFLADPIGNELVPVVDPADANKTKGVDIGNLATAAAAPAVRRAETARDGAEAAAVAALLALGDGLYTSVADGLAATDPGEGFYVRDDDGGLSLWINEAGVARRYIAFATRASLRNNGINLWEEAGRNGSTDPADMIATTNAIKSVMADAARWGIGLVNCGGRDRTYVCGGPYATLGDSTIIAKDGTRTVPFTRGRIPLVSGVELRGASPVSRPKFLAAPGDRDPGGMFYTRFWDADGGVTGAALRWIEIDGNRAKQTYSAYKGGGSDEGMWIQSHAISGGSMHDFALIESRVHGWCGHAVFAFQALDFGKTSDDWKMIGNDIYDNDQGGAQIAHQPLS